MTELDWAPTACTLPTVEQPLREREFSALFAGSLRGVHLVGATRAELTLDPASETAARDLAVRESSCCSFFTFEFESDVDALTMRVTVPEQHAAVLEALVASATRDAGLTASGAA
ncbi:MULTISPECIES: hypothetical protein [Agromyces]|uniref:Arsenate reductase n=1 Tax=Agromyces aureus TaxID=453304 RepID=A0A191WGB8_9MICO|nr:MULTISPECIES: hypothetical protein [Agromyces]ANJ27340.1 hypothetical protein ATC03_12045 [Agromyces aureus]KQM83640.1 hypothetical protein ASE68_10780 [Agromyces sp. Leaf222]